MLSRIIEWLRRLLARLGGRDDVTEPRARIAEGEFRPESIGQDPRKYPPAEGFGNAIQNALDTIDHDEWPAGRRYDVSIALKADMSVENPGQIDTYKAIISEP